MSIRWDSTELLVVLTTHKPVKKVVGMHVGLSMFVLYFLQVKKIAGFNAFGSVYKKSIIEERSQKALALLRTILIRTIQPVLQHVASIAEILVYQVPHLDPK